MLDELHLLGRNPHTPKVLRQIRGGLEKTPEGLLIITTTQSDDIPAGAFKDELTNARRIRDGHFRGKVSRPLLPVLYEFPPAIGKHRERWGDPANWPMVMPNLGRSVQLDSLVADWQTEQTKNDQAIRIWAVAALEYRNGLRAARPTAGPARSSGLPPSTRRSTLDTLISRSEVVVIGVDGGGLDDLFGLAVLGRERETKNWLSWSHAWCHRGVLQRRLCIASRLEDFAAAGELTIVDDKLDDISAIVDIVERVKDAGVLSCVALDIEGPYGEFVDALAEHRRHEASGADRRHRPGLPADGRDQDGGAQTCQRHDGSCAERPDGLVLRQREDRADRHRDPSHQGNAGDAKIDPWCALMDAATVMVKHPDRAPTYEMFVV